MLNRCLIFCWLFLVASVGLAQNNVENGEVLFSREEETDDDKGQYPVGLNIAAFGGANFLQTGKVSVRETYTGLGLSDNFKVDSGVGAALGFKVGFVWPEWEDFINPGHFLSMFEIDTRYVNGDVRLMPAIDLEFFYTGREMKAKDADNGSIETEMDIYVFSINPMMKVQVGAFRPYIGMGLGAAYMDVQNMDYNLTFNGVAASGRTFGDGEAAMAFAFQGIIGAEWFLWKNWSIMGEYKYLTVVDPQFHVGNTDLDRTEYQLFDNHLFVVGARYHF